MLDTAVAGCTEPREFMNSQRSVYVGLLTVCWCSMLHRSTSSVRKLVCNFEAPDDDVFTLYDNWEKAVARFPHVSITENIYREAGMA